MKRTIRYTNRRWRAWVKAAALLHALGWHDYSGVDGDGGLVLAIDRDPPPEDYAGRLFCRGCAF